MTHEVRGDKRRSEEAKGCQRWSEEVRGVQRRSEVVRGGRWTEDFRADKRKTSAQEETRKYNFPSFWEIMTDIPTAYPIN